MSCHQRAGFKDSVQENPSGKEHHKHNHEKHEKPSPLNDLCPEMNLTNHSARKTVPNKLKSSGIPKCEMKNITGHASANGLDNYDSGDKREQQIISRAINNSGPFSSRGVLSQLCSANSTPSLCAPGHVHSASSPGMMPFRRAQVIWGEDTSVSSSKNQIQSDLKAS